MTRIFIAGDSMNPTYEDGDVVLLWEGGFTVGRYDVVVAKTGQGSIVKRVVGLSGDTVRIEGGRVYINGSPIAADFDYLTECGGVGFEEYEVPEDCFFLLGDNRQNSTDSRELGAVPQEDIKGIVLFRIFPPF